MKLTNMSKDRSEIITDPNLQVSSSSISSTSDVISIFGHISGKGGQRKYGTQRKNCLLRLFEKKKLKDKSLSKKIKTPFDRKLNRTCWPVELSKVSKIKKKPREKKKEKPTHKSLKKKKFSNPTFTLMTVRARSPSSDTSGSELHPSHSSNEILRNLNHSHFLYEPVTPQMLMDILRDPEHLKSGATINMIIAKLRALKLELNPTLELLKEEVLQKLDCAIKLGLVVENNGLYTIADKFRLGKLPRKKVDAFWQLWNRRATRCTCRSKR